jgi:hypothetical protein
MGAATGLKRDLERRIGSLLPYFHELIGYMVFHLYITWELDVHATLSTMAGYVSNPN